MRQPRNWIKVSARKNFKITIAGTLEADRVLNLKFKCSADKV
jgi:hypothetical protein